MEKEYTAVVKKDGKWWIGWVEEVPGINCQEATHQDLMETLKITLKEAIEFNRKEALSAAESDYSEEIVKV